MAKTTERTIPTPDQAIEFLKSVSGIVTYPDIDATTDEGATKLAARWACFESSLISLANLLNAADAVCHQLATGEASDGDQRDIAWCERTLREAIEGAGEATA